MSRDSRLFLEDIEQSCARIISYVEARSKEEVFNDPMRLDAILMNLQVIGEAVKNLPEELRQRSPEVPWREIAGMRDIVAHAYFALDLDILWNAIQESVPALLAEVQKIIERENMGGVNDA